MTTATKLIDADKISLAMIDDYLRERESRKDSGDMQDFVLEFISGQITPPANDPNRIHARLVNLESTLNALVINTTTKNKERLPRNEQLAKERCQAVARLLWAQDSTITISAMSEHSSVYNLDITGGQRYKQSTVYTWVAEAFPKNQEKQIGRPRRPKKDK
jgi:hypothetical protein